MSSTNERPAGQSVSFFIGLLTGAALMYVFDPERGRRRRAIILDKSRSAASHGQSSLQRQIRHLSNRASGVAAALTSPLSIARHVTVADDVLERRIRSELGRVVDVRNIQVKAENGTVSLTGLVERNKLEALLSAIQRIRDVKNVRNELTVH